MEAKKVELLSPAGSMESAKAAIQNGCDAIYLAGKQFGARAFAANFDDEQLCEVIRYAHAYGVKVYITLNTLIHDYEMASCQRYIQKLYECCKADAVIVQDLGIVHYIRKNYPDFEVHASTQMHVVNEEALHFLWEQGIPRAVLAREVNIEEIKRFAKLPIALEVFVHGALCVAYSGQCLMSHMIGGRSGNRGECAQSCRMPYSLIAYESGKELHKQAYLLSLKDLNTLDHIPELIEAGVASFKMEGRMKKSEYVGYMTRLYKKKIDEPSYMPSEEEKEASKLLFHRGYTEGMLYQKKGSALYNPIRPNHIGIEVGKVLSYAKGRVRIQLQKTLYQGDGVRLLLEKEDVGFKVNKMYLQGLLVNKAEANDIIELEVDRFVKKGSILLKTSDPRLEKEIENTYDKLYRKVPVSAEVWVSCGKPLRMSVKDDKHTVEVVSEHIVEAAKQRAAQKEDVIKQIDKSGDTIFVFENIQIHMEEEVFLPVKVLNALRREVLSKMYEVRAQEIERENRTFIVNKVAIKAVKGPVIYAKVREESQLVACLEEKVARIYVEEKSLYEKYKEHEQVVFCAPRIAKNGYKNTGMIADIGGLYQNSNFDTDTSLNVYNASSAYYLKTLGARCITLSLELTKEEVKTLVDTYQKTYGHALSCQVVVYGRPKVMISEHCPVNACLLDNDKKHCTLCRKETLALKDKFGNAYPMYNDAQCRMHLYDYRILDRTEDVSYYRSVGIPVLRYDFTWEKAEDISYILAKGKG